MPFRLVLCLLAVFAGLTAVPARVDAAPSVGDAVQGHLTLERVQVPLPEGPWRLAAVDEVPGPDGRTLQQAALLRVRDGVVEAVVLIHANPRSEPQPGTAPPARGWGMSSDCRRKDLHRVHVFHDRDGFGACGFVGHLIPDDAGGADRPAWTRAMAEAEAAGWRLPDTWLVVGHRLTDREDLLDIRFHVNPEALGFPPAARGRPWADNDWAEPVARTDPARMAVLSRLTRWMFRSTGTVTMGSKNQLGADGPVLPMPWDTPVPLLAPDAVVRAEGIARLAAAGEISPDAADRQIHALEAEARKRAEKAGMAEASPWELLWWKAMTNRSLHLVASVGIDYVFLGNWLGALTLAGTHSVLGIVDYVAHEWAWMEFGPTAVGPSTIYDVPLAGTFR